MLCDLQAWTASAGAVPNAQLEQMQQKLQQQPSQGAVPRNFVPTAAAHDPAAPQQQGRMPQQAVRNPQTEQFLDLLGLPYNLDHVARVVPGNPPHPGSEGLLIAVVHTAMASERKHS